MSALPNKVRKVHEGQHVSRLTSPALDNREVETEERERKVPVVQSQTPLSPVPESEEVEATLPMEVSSPEAKDHPTACQRQKFDLRMDDVIPKKLRKIGKNASFIPLSISRGMQDVWWRPIKVVPLEGSDRWLLMTVHLFINCAGEIPCPNMNDNMIVEFKVEGEDVLMISYLNRMCTELIEHSPNAIVRDYDSWKRHLLEMGEIDPVKIAVSAFEENVLHCPITKLGNHFNWFFCKKPAVYMEVPGGCFFERNMFSVVRNVEEKDFKYEYRACIFYTKTPYKY